MTSRHRASFDSNASSALGSISETHSYHSDGSNSNHDDIFPGDSISQYRPDMAELKQRKQIVERVSFDSGVSYQQSDEGSIPPKAPQSQISETTYQSAAYETSHASSHAMSYASTPSEPPSQNIEFPSSPQASPSQGIELDYSVDLPTLSYVQKTRDGVLFLFDSAEPHPRIRRLAKEPNVVFIGTRKHNGKPFKDKNIVDNIKQIKADIKNLQKHLESKQYVRLLVSNHGFGVGSGLCLNAPKTWKAFKIAMDSFFQANSEHALLNLRWQEWETEAELYHEELAPEFQQMRDQMRHEMEKKKDQWQLNQKLAYKEQKKKIKRANRRNHQKLQDQKRKLRRERMKEEILNEKRAEMKRHNELLKMQKDIERRHTEKQKDLHMQMEILQDRMAHHSMQVQTELAIKGVAKMTTEMFTDFAKETNEDDIGGDMYNASVFSGLSETDESDDNNGRNDSEMFWQKMKKVDEDMKKMRETMGILKDL